jgi:Rad3-related DNA helicase
MLIKADQVNVQNKPHLVMSRLEREMLEEAEREEQEPKEPKYHTWYEANDRGYRQNDFV